MSVSAPSHLVVERVRRRSFYLLASFSTLVLVGLSLLYLSVGSYPCSLFSASSCGPVLGIRVVRLIVALSVGGLLGVSGSLVQASTRNILAEPYLLGISSGALAAVSLAYLALPLSEITSIITALAAFGGGLAAFTTTMLVSEAAGGSAASLLLAGVAVTAITSGVAEALLTIVEVSRGLPFLVLLLGTAAYSGVGDALTLAAVLSTTPITVALLAKPLNALVLGDDYAEQLGFNPRVLRRAASIIAALYASITVASVGIVGFVGLVAPNIARIVSGSDHRYSMPASILLGSLITLASDLAARVASLTPLGELPLGLYTSIVGGGFLAYLVATRMRRGLQP